MTYCVAMRLNAGLVFLGDSRTNAGVDQISTFRKMTVFENPGERMLVLLTAGNLALTQAVTQILSERVGPEHSSVWTATTMVEAVRIIGDAVREVHHRDAAALNEFGIDFNAKFIFGGQIKGEGMRLFHVYSAGNFIEATQRKSVLSDRRSEIRQADHRPRHPTGHAARRGREVRVDLDGLDVEVEYLSRACRSICSSTRPTRCASPSSCISTARISTWR